jgi:hypothetical protein
MSLINADKIFQTGKGAAPRTSIKQLEINQSLTDRKSRPKEFGGWAKW